MTNRRRKRHSPEQIIKKLREAEAMIAVGKTIGQVIQALQISEATYNRWRNGHRRASGGRRLKELEQENGRLCELVFRRPTLRVGARQHSFAQPNT